MEPFTFHKEYLVREFSRQLGHGNPNILHLNYLYTMNDGFPPAKEEERAQGRLWMDRKTLERHYLHSSLDLVGKVLDFEFAPIKSSEISPEHLFIYELSRIERAIRTLSIPPIVNTLEIHKAELKSFGFETKEDLPRYELTVLLTSNEYQKLVKLPGDAAIGFSIKLTEREREKQHADF